jgi:hypothetical protein
MADMRQQLATLVTTIAPMVQLMQMQVMQQQQQQLAGPQQQDAGPRLLEPPPAASDPEEDMQAAHHQHDNQQQHPTQLGAEDDPFDYEQDHHQQQQQQQQQHATQLAPVAIEPVAAEYEQQAGAGDEKRKVLSHIDSSFHHMEVGRLLCYSMAWTWHDQSLRLMH